MFVCLGHSKAWLSFNRFITVYKKLFTSRKTAQLRSRFVSLFGVRQTRLSPPAFRQMNLTLCIRAPSCFSLLSQNLSRLFHCSVIKVVCRSRFKRQLLYLTRVICFCQELFLFIFCYLLTWTYVMGLSGLEPPTSRLSGVRSNRLSYKPI